MTVNAILRQGSVFRTAPLTQYDEGQKIHLSGVELPASYLAEFANSESGTAEQIAQTTDTVTIPDKYLTSGNPIYCWIVVVGEDERTTRYEIIVPVKGRGEPDDYTPTPEEQTAIEAAIAALNSAVTAAGVAIEHYPRITDGVWYVWDVTNGEWVSTEVPAQGPQGETGATGNGIASAVLNADYTLTLTFTNGTTYTTPSIRGAQGAQGDPGPAGQDGYSPTASVSKSGNTATITITDKNGTTTAQVSDGATGQTGPAGADGYSPTATVSKSGGVATISITDKQGTTTAQVTDGSPGPGVPAGGTAGQLLSKKTTGVDYDTEWVNAPTIPVTDVQVNGTSILSQGVANVPVASTSNLGVAKINVNQGIGIDSVVKALYISSSSEGMSKTGTNVYKPIVPANQHAAAFFGLAKAAGADMASSSNAVGNYTDAAKIAIQKMLGLNPWEKIAEVTSAEDLVTLDITTDLNGQAFELSAMYARIELSPTTTGTADQVAVFALGKNESDADATRDLPYLTYDSATGKMFAVVNAEIISGIMESYARYGGSGYNSRQSMRGLSSAASSVNLKSLCGLRLSRFNSSQTLIPSGSKVTIYGKRK